MLQVNVNYRRNNDNLNCVCLESHGKCIRKHKENTKIKNADKTNQFSVSHMVKSAKARYSSDTDNVNVVSAFTNRHSPCQVINLAYCPLLNSFKIDGFSLRQNLLQQSYYTLIILAIQDMAEIELINYL